jgi:alpha-2-macroglobulin
MRASKKFAAYTTNSNLVNIPMSYLQTQNPKQNLVLDKQGNGRLYYRIGMKYAPKNLKSVAADYGFSVSRTYEAIDDPADVKQNADGSWTIKSGSRVRVRLQMIAPARRYHVALVDNLPAGVEIINPDLAVSKSTEVTDSKEFQGSSRWFDHQNLRDNRTEAFTSLLWEGNWNYSYIARATTPGIFVVPPAKAEEMYSPETFGRSKSDAIIIE